MSIKPSFALKHFNELTTFELYKILQLRIEVFIVEQNCVYQDLDNKDLRCHHYFIDEEQKCLAACRILAPGVSYPAYSSIGRVLTDMSVRKKSYGRQMMSEAIDITKKMYPQNAIKISAQAYLQKFYESLGFAYTGEAYIEDNIPHIGMVLKF